MRIYTDSDLVLFSLARWLALRFAFFSTLFVSLVAFMLIWLQIEPGVAGVLLMYSTHLYAFQYMGAVECILANIAIV